MNEKKPSHPSSPKPKTVATPKVVSAAAKKSTPTADRKADGKADIIADLEKRVADKILEPNNFDLLKKLVLNADTLNEAIMIAELGTTYKRTGFHFDKRLEKLGDTIRYFKKNTELSFGTDKDALTHKLIIGDNYPALLNLLIEYKGRVDVIYIDPPYGKDYMGYFAKTNYENAITRDNLLSMLYPRLLLAKRLLSDSGVIFCSIDDRNMAYVRGLFDEVFGESNFIASIVWERAFAPISLKRHFSVSHDYMLCFAKNEETAFCKGRKRDEEADNRYTNPDNDPRGVWSSDNLSVGPAVEENIYPITTPGGRVVTPPKGRSWSLSKSVFAEKRNDNRIWFGSDGNGVPRVKRFLSELRKPGITPMTVWRNEDVEVDRDNEEILTLWKYEEVGHSQDATKALKSILSGEKCFEYPKPVGLIKKALSLYSNNDSIILDFFAGSGTTGQAVLELNKEDGDEGKRQFILVTNNEITPLTPNGIAINATSKRLKRVMTGKCYDESNDFEWAKKNKPLGGNLLVLDIAEVANFESTAGKTPFDVIDETLYGQEKIDTVKEKTLWVCNNFEITQKRLE